jgi:hypothetical protein
MQNKLAREIEKLFGPNRIVCLLYYGSKAFNRSKSEYSDFDFYLMLDEYKDKDTVKLRELITKYNLLDITVQYKKDIERKGWDRYQHGNHGIFFMLHHASAITLLGTNIFQRKLTTLEAKNVIASLLFQIEEYFWRLNHWYFTEKDTQKVIIKYEKYIVRIIQDMLVIRGDISFFEINTVDYLVVIKQFMNEKAYFSKNTCSLALECYSQDNSIEKLIELQRYLYEDYLAMYENERGNYPTRGT